MSRLGLHLPVDLGHLDWAAEKGRTYVQVYHAILRNVRVFSDTTETTVPSGDPGVQYPGMVKRSVAGSCVVAKSYLAKAAGVDGRNLSRILEAMQTAGLIDVKVGVGKGPAPSTAITLLSKAFLVRREDPDMATGKQIKKERPEDEEDMVGASQLKLVSDRTLYQMPLKDGTSFNITEAHIAELEETYKSQVDVDTHLRRAVQWCRDNPDKRKTKRGARKFISGWLSRAATPYRPKSFSGEPDTEVQCESCGAEMDEPTENGYCDICKKAVGG
jgi:hypothetical protein